jgi:hypothetical protein
MKHRKMQRHYLAALIPLFVALSGPVSAQSITAITAIPQAGNNIFKHLGHGLQVATICHDGGSVMIAFQNLGSDDATLNWWYGMYPYKAQPTGTSPGLVNASGVGVNAYGVVVRGGGLYEWTSGSSACRSRGSSSSRTTKATPPSTCTPSTAPRSVKFGAPLCLRRTGRV